VQVWRHHKLHLVPAAQVQLVTTLHCHLLEFPAAPPPHRAAQHSSVSSMSAQQGIAADAGPSRAQRWPACLNRHNPDQSVVGSCQVQSRLLATAILQLQAPAHRQTSTCRSTCGTTCGTTASPNPLADVITALPVGEPLEKGKGHFAGHNCGVWVQVQYSWHQVAVVRFRMGHLHQEGSRKA
jgi:hypothetical protein